MKRYQYGHQGAIADIIILWKIGVVEALAHINFLLFSIKKQTFMCSEIDKSSALKGMF